MGLPLPGEEFVRSCDNTCLNFCIDWESGPFVFPAHPSSFLLDKFEVTVARFRAFAYQFNAAKPAEGAGKILHNAADLGWDAAWNEDFLAASQVDLLDALKDSTQCDGPLMWTESVGSHEDRPMNCVTWYEAQAFCIWDGGRLPTEAEWNYAAAGGAEQRVYPWSDPADSTAITPADAVYQSSENMPTEPAVVGSNSSPGKWKHLDLAGNVAEWTSDGYLDCYVPVECNDCGTTRGQSDKVVRGGSFNDADNRVTVESRAPVDGNSRLATVGFRCVHDF